MAGGWLFLIFETFLASFVLNLFLKFNLIITIQPQLVLNFQQNLSLMFCIVCIQIDLWNKIYRDHPIVFPDIDQTATRNILTYALHYFLHEYLFCTRASRIRTKTHKDTLFRIIMKFIIKFIIKVNLTCCVEQILWIQ